MIVAAHQPHYLPWLGYLDKVANCDVFVVMDDLQYEAQNFQNRNRVKINHGAHWLTVPLLSGAQNDRIVDKRIDNTGFGGRHHWQHRARRTLEVHYHRAPHFAEYARDLEDVYARRWTYLVELDLHMLDLARSWFGITVPIVRASSLGLRAQRTERILSMCEALGANTYFSGRGGSTGYLDTALLARAGVATIWQQFQHPVYPQRYSNAGFVSHLAFVDLLFNCGSGSAALLWPRARSGMAASQGSTP